MKSHTDLPQSKELAEILPLESADHFHIIGHLHTDGPRYEVIRSKNEVSDHDSYWPCWSLAALLDVLPEINGIPLTLEKVKAEDGYDGYYYHIEYKDKILIPYSKNPVDACYEMILKLHEQNII